MSEYKKITVLYDDTTGEILKEEEGTYKIPNFIKFKETHRFSKTYHVHKVTFDNNGYYKYFYNAICNLEIGTNRIVEHSRDLYGGRSLTISDLADICETSIRTIQNFMDYCMQHKIIRKMDLDNEFFGYFVNPKYVFNGSTIQPILYLMFIGYGIEEFISNSGVKLLNQYITTFNIKDIINHTYETKSCKIFPESK